MIGLGIVVASAVGSPWALQVPRHRPLPVEELVTGATLAGVAVVERLATFRDPESRFIFTDAHLRMEEVWKGEGADGIRLRQFGGRLGDQEGGIVGWGYELKPGERIVIFAVPFRDGSYTLKGSRQGLFRISKTQPPTVVKDLHVDRIENASMTLEALKQEVYLALGREAPSPKPPDPARELGTPVGAPTTEAPAVSVTRPPASEKHAEAPHAREPRPWPRWLFALLLLAGAGAVGFTLWMSRKPKIRPSGNGGMR